VAGGEAEGVKKIVQGSAAYRKAGNKFGEHDQSNGGINEFKRRAPLNERGYDQKNNGQQIKQDKAIPKPYSAPAFSFVQFP
jgi:hypothetical protein